MRYWLLQFDRRIDKIDVNWHVLLCTYYMVRWILNTSCVCVSLCLFYLGLWMYEIVGGVWRYQRNNRNLLSEEKQITQCPKEKDIKWSTKRYTEKRRSSNTNPTKHRGWTQLLRRVPLVTNPVIRHEWGKDRVLIIRNG